MPKSILPFNAGEYALVADRISLFYERFPEGRIITHLVSRDRDVVFRAEVYRSELDTQPAATGWASEREGDGDINLVACVENTETSAIGRALANLGFTASKKRPSYEEMAKADRARVRYQAEASRPAPTTVSPLPARVAEARQAEPETAPAPRAEIPPVGPAPPATPVSDQAADVLALLQEAARIGVPEAVTTTFSTRVRDGLVSADALTRIERQVRYWILNGFSGHSAPPPDEPEPPAVNT